MKKDRYTVRWVTKFDSASNNLKQIEWEVIDWTKFDNIGVQTFPVSEKEQANGLCRLLNSIEEESDGLSK